MARRAVYTPPVTERNKSHCRRWPDRRPATVCHPARLPL